VDGAQHAHPLLSLRGAASEAFGGRRTGRRLREADVHLPAAAHHGPLLDHRDHNVPGGRHSLSVSSRQ